MAAGFIHDKLDIKLLILYVLSRVNEPVRREDVQMLTMIDGGIDYFDFAECLGDLVTTEHLTLSDDGYYQVTAKGVRNSEICESTLPYSVRLHAEKMVEDFNRDLLRKSQVKGRYKKRENGAYTVTLSLDDDVDNVFRLELMVTAEHMARELVDRFERNPEKVYGKLIDALFS